jgi:RNA polymerase sigma-70 factor (ECF subfamily)
MNHSATVDPQSSELSNTVTQSWKRFLEICEPLRPALYRFCRYLSRSPWDAKDLVQDTLARAFATLGGLREPPRDRRAWLFRVASNLWIDQSRRRGVPASRAGAAPNFASDRDTREAARLRNYFYTPEVIAELCGELDLPCRTNGTFRARGDA